MNKKKDNNHFISEFQLRHFRSAPPPRKPGKYFVWVYDQKEEPDCRNIKKVASYHQFYGKEDDRLEDAFAVSESKNGAMYAAILSGSNLPVKFEHEMGNLFWLLAFRTRAMRDRMRSGIHKTASLMADTALGVDAAGYLTRNIDLKVGEAIAEALPQQTPEQNEILKKYILENIDRNQLGGVMQMMFQAFAAHVNTDTFDNSHNTSLQRFLDSGGVCPEPRRPESWAIVQNPDKNFVLGDAGVFCVDREKKISTFVGASNDWREAYLPISPSLAVVGMRGIAVPTMTPEEIVTASISTSGRQFYADVFSAALADRALKEINSAGELIGDADVAEITTSVWQEK
ncbi:MULTISPECIES: DUF4238 domain-containing protein [unclassified Mesorhizobium]|uniref:DUF4238 domain-containing protein n=2 Tax=Mesorhizobium TaxID=68287 RepID=UPI0003CE449C|nr:MULTISPECIES: DUF4238 domain-containing protein [unclassified Mesorhizobium]ESX16977.1 hypothetical protein X766_20285 [Mesorhizobium sp. LSJC255A00]WJI56138.1 DUF4238 domain-containing protein [Mesorhizobium sp. C432A]